MSFGQRANRRAPLFLGLLIAAALSAPPGCTAPNGKLSASPTKHAPSAIDPTRVLERDDIVSIHQFWAPVPWLFSSENEVTGFRVPVYFVSGETEKGAFVSGKIYVWLYTLEPTNTRKLQRNFTFGWEFTTADAMNFRVRKEAVTGYYYGFLLNWPDDLDLENREIEIVFGYERGDGQIIASPARRFRVPASSYARESAPAPPQSAPPPGARTARATPPAIAPPPAKRTATTDDQPSLLELMRAHRAEQQRAAGGAEASASPPQTRGPSTIRTKTSVRPVKRPASQPRTQPPRRESDSAPSSGQPIAYPPPPGEAERPVEREDPK